MKAFLWAAAITLAFAPASAQRASQQPAVTPLGQNLSCLAQTIATWPREVTLPFGMGGLPPGTISPCMWDAPPVGPK